MVRLSIVVPVYNEVGILRELHRRLSLVLDQLGLSWELVLVDDGSRDGSTELMRQLAEEDRRVRPVIFARNFGHQIAITAGLDYARGEAVVIMDADLQDPPEVIPKLLDQWQAGFQVVHAVRSEREGESIFKKATAAIFYRVLKRITAIDIPLDAGDFRLLDRKAVDTLTSMRERHRFPRGMAAWIGYRQTSVVYKRAARTVGETKYPLGKMVRLALTAITGFSYFPLQIATYVGFLAAGFSLVAIPIVVVLRLTGNQAFFGQASTLLAVLFLGGVQLISLGILGEYVGRLYDEVKGRPLYVVAEAPEEIQK